MGGEHVFAIANFDSALPRATERNFKGFNTERTETFSNIGGGNFLNTENTEKTGDGFSVPSAEPELADGVEGEPLLPLR